MTESFFKIKSLKEVMEPFLNVRNFKSPKKVMESFFGIKNFKTKMVSFLGLKTLRVVRKQPSPFFSIKNFKSRKAVVEFSVSFKHLRAARK